MPLAPEKDYTPEELGELYGHTVSRGRALRRRRRAALSTAIVILLAAVVVPVAAATRSQVPEPPDLATVAAGPYADVAWRTVEYPGLNFATIQYPRRLGCGENSSPTPTGFVFPVDVQQVSYLQPTDGPRLAVVLVRCLSGTPTPSSLYAFDGVEPGGHPHLFAALLTPPNSGDGPFWYGNSFSTAGDEIAMSTKGVTGTAPICCPNVSALMRWTWNGHTFARSITTTP
ncbi:MAG TPA: hypothetical protein VIX84_17790 [Acidimicrobiales bacterium]